MEKKLSMTEIYTLLLLYGENGKIDCLSSQYSAGIVLGGLIELIDLGKISSDKDGRLSVKNIDSDVPTCFVNIYKNIEEHSEKTMKYWLEYYCFQPSYSKIRPIVDDVFFELERKKYILIDDKRGIFRKKRTIKICEEKAKQVIDAFIFDVESGKQDAMIIFCVEMLILADVFKRFFPVKKSVQVKSVLDQYRQSDIWSSMEVYTNSVQNFNYQNAVYTGASE